MVPLSVLGQMRRKLFESLDAAAGLPAARRLNPVSALHAFRSSIRADSTPSSDVHPELHVLCRTLEQLAATLSAGVRSVFADFQDIRQYGQAVTIAHSHQARIFLATPRIQKPAEGPLFKHLLRHEADGILVRNLGALLFFTTRQIPIVADFSLNAANEISVQLLRERGAQRVTAAHDLNADQLLDLIAAVPPRWLELVIHQHMPMFHMEHCVFCAFLSPGTDRTNCGRPCDRHEVRLRDRVGSEHLLKADVGCRNTLFNAVPQSAAEHVGQFLKHGVRHFRIELLDETPQELAQVIDLYRCLLGGKVTGQAVWRKLRATNHVGVTRGPLDR
jgi:putative protease